MNKRPLVSVAMGVYNCAATVDEALRSIQEQSYGDLEIVVCDDGSTDATAETVAARATSDARIKLLRSPVNRGLAATLNRCLAAATGTCLARMDGDDFSRPHRIAAQVEWLELHPEFDWCGCSIDLWDGKAVWGTVDYPERPTAADFRLRSPFAHPTVVFRSDALRGAGGYDEDPALGRSEDYELFFRLFAAGRRGANLPERLFAYRESPDAYRKRKFRFALTEARVRWRGFRSLGLLPSALPYVLKPLAVALLPLRWYAAVRKRLFG